MTFISCYFLPNRSDEEFKDDLERMGNSCLITRTKAIIGGDFNAKAPDWGSPRTDNRGHKVTEWAARYDLTITNKGIVPTFVRDSYESIIDLT